jgi:hypothetical protein
MAQQPNSQRSRLRWTLAACLVACAAGVVYAVGWGEAADGARGGAVAVAIAFYMLFTGRGTAVRVLEQRDAQGKPVINNGTVEQRIGLVATATSTLIDSAREERRYLAAASVIGTLVWGFGDGLASQLGAPAERLGTPPALEQPSPDLPGPGSAGG